MLLIEEGNIDGVSELLAKGTDLNVQNKSGQTALAIAAKNGAKAIVHKLLAHGAEINLKNKVTNEWQTELMCKVWTNSTIYSMLAKLRRYCETSN